MKDTIKKYKRIIKILATTVTVAFTIYTLIPKTEKIEGINTAALETYSKDKENL